MIKSYIKSEAKQSIAMLGHIILQNDIFHDIVVEVYGATGSTVLQSLLELFNTKVYGIPGIR